MINKIFGYSYIWEENFSNKGFLQGIGFSVKTRVLRIFGLKFITDVKFEGTNEWLRDLKKRIKEDDTQQWKEQNR